MSQADIIDGAALATRVRRDIQQQVQTLSDRCSEPPGLAVVLVGQDPASQIYVRNKRRQTREVGMRSFEHNLPESTSQAALTDLIQALNEDSRVNGILVQLPLPRHISSAAVLAAIDPHKDVDGFHEVNTGRLWHGEAALVPCTPLGCIKLLKHRLGNDLSGLHAVVIGTSNIVGKPLSSLLLRQCCTVTMAHQYTRHLPTLTRQADILVAATGRANLVRGDWIKPGATVIDVGINRVAGCASGDQYLVGDVAFGEASRVAGALTPVPGGVGPMTIACLLQNTLAATLAALKGLTVSEHSLGISA